MKKLFYLASFMILNMMSFAQDTLKRPSHWHYLNNYEISGYLLSFLDNASDNFLWQGSELKINLISYQTGRHEVGISSGMFFVNRRPEEKSNPNMQYFYFPLYANYVLYSKNRKFYGKFTMGLPLLTYDDSKLSAHGSFWLNYETALEIHSYQRGKIQAINDIRFGYQFSRYFGANIGAMTYFYSEKFNPLLRIALGIELRL